MGWWDAYMFTLARIIGGAGLLSACLVWIYMAYANKK